ncbi:MAG TPA: FkbM family methyltransferase [Oscillatoriaceae cyanobacterium]
MAIPLPDGVNKLGQTRRGLVLYNAHDNTIGRSIELYGEFAEFEAQLFEKLLRPGDVAVDVGANIGVLTLAMARAVGPSGSVLAFEPQRILAQMIAANLALNSQLNTHVFNMALGAEPGTIMLPPIDYDRANNFGALSLGGFTEGEAVQLACLDSFELQRCRLIKADVEGMELAVLRGATQTIRRTRPVLYVENNRPEQSAALVAFIRSLSYTLYWHRSPYFNPHNFAGNPDPAFAEFAPERNILCLPTELPQTMSGFEEVS